MRPLLFSLVLFASFNTHAATEEDVIKTVPRFSQQFRLPLSDGTLLGFDAGEWGGRLIFLDRQGQATLINQENVNGLAKAGAHVLVFSGLDHLGGNTGSILELIRDKNGVPTVRPLLALQGTPLAIQQVDGETVLFRVGGGRDKQGKFIYSCKLIGADLQVADIACQ
jgi:hypothetical protein